MITANLVALGMLAASLGSDNSSGANLLLAGMQVWLTNVIGFGLLFWDLDRDGPVTRYEARREDLPPADWWFSKNETTTPSSKSREHRATKAAGPLTLTDYLYLSLANSSAFSPTDTMPLTTRAKTLMGIQASAALLTSLLVVARAVGSLAGGQG